MAPCPAPYTVDHAVAAYLSLRLQIVDGDDNVVGDATDALTGSPAAKLQVPVGPAPVNLLLDLTTASQHCASWEITAFNLTVIGVQSFVVTIGKHSSRTVPVCLLYPVVVVVVDLYSASRCRASNALIVPLRRKKDEFSAPI